MRINLSTKIISLFILGGIIPMVAIGILSYINSSKSLEKQAFNQLTAVRDIKRAFIDDWFTKRKCNIVTFAKDEMVVYALKEFKTAFHQLGAQKARDLYITQNPYPVGKKLEYIDAGDGSNYSKLHARFHPIFKQYLEEYGYYDIFLVDGESGDILYTVYKELDFGTSLISGIYNTTNIAALFKEAKTTQDLGFVKLTDFEAYAPSNGAPASFIAHPVYDNNQKIGVLIFQMPIDKIDAVMQERSGMGETGETYLVGPDKLMRSNSRFSEKATILSSKIDTVAAKDALEGKTDFKIINDYRGTPVLSAYAPFTVLGLKWAIIAEIDKAEAFKSVYDLRKWMIIIGLASAGFVAGLGILVVRITSKISGLFKSMLVELTGGASQVASASEQISASSQSLSQGTSEQAASIEETSSTMEEMSSMTRQNADNASEASRLAKACNETAGHGNTAVYEMDDAMKKIFESSGKIADIIKIIEGIAFQTNLLALNAAVEAARAGEHGRGFAVVAEEVRNLAQRSSTAAKDITALITDSVKKAESGTTLVKRTKEVFTEVVAQIKKVTDLINEIATASEEQTNGIQQVSKAIQQMEQVIQQNAANAEETAAASEELSSQAQGLNALVDRIAAEVGTSSDVMAGEDKISTARETMKKDDSGYSNEKILPSPARNTLLSAHKQSASDTGRRSGRCTEKDTVREGNGKKRITSDGRSGQLFPMTDDEFKDF